MELLLNALLSVVIDSSKEADLAVNYGINTPIHQRRCLGRDELDRLKCEKELKKLKQVKPLKKGGDHEDS